jgi:methylphosphotriester-DNA--protein-cysteine methyltransferase
MLCWMMLATTAGWTTGPILLVCPAVLSCVLFPLKLGMSFGRWRQQARLFAALEMLAQGRSVTEAAVAVGNDSVSAFIEMFRKMLGTTPQMYFRSTQERVPK